MPQNQNLDIHYLIQLQNNEGFNVKREFELQVEPSRVCQGRYCSCGCGYWRAAHGGAEAQAASTAPDPLLNGVCDIHVHCEPDVRGRSSNALELARKCKQSGYRALMLKGHDLTTCDHAYLVRLAEPDFEIFGGIALNKVYGNVLNVTAVQKALQVSGKLCKCVWMPTQASVWDSQHHGNKEKGVVGVPVSDSKGKLLPEVTKIMELCAEANIIFATGHSSPVECVAMSKRAKELKVPKFVVTHVTSDIWTLTKDQVKTCIDNGAYIEHTFNATLMGPGTKMPQYGYTSMETIAEYIRLAPEHTFFTTDFGNELFGDPVEGMRNLINQLKNLKFTQKEIDYLVRTNPKILMGLKA